MRRRSPRLASRPASSRPTSARPVRTGVLGLVVAALVAVGPAVAGPAPAVAGTRATGEPIPLSFANLDATSSTIAARQGVHAAVEHLNRTGGIGGRPLAVTECKTDQNPESGRACADAAVAAGVVAVFAVQPGTLSDAVPVLTAAGIPYVAQTCNTSTTLGGQYSTFCFGSDFVGLYASGAAYLRGLGVQTVALPYVDVPAAATGIKAYGEPTLQRAGIAPIEVPIPEGTADVSATLTTVLQTQAPGAVISLLTGPGCVSTMQTRAQESATQPFVFPALCTDPDVVADAGPGAKGSLFVRQTVALDKKDPDVKTYRKAIARYARNADPDDVFTQAGFAGMMNLAAALRQVPAGTPLDAASATAALQSAADVPMVLSPGATYTCDGSAFPGLRALCSIQAHLLEYQGKGRWSDKGLF